MALLIKHVLFGGICYSVELLFSSWVVEVTDGSKSDDDSHAFLILSREDSTMILQTGQEIMELENSGFNTISPTIFAGNLGNNKYILQVSPSEVRLLQGAEEIHKVELEAGTQVKHCSIADPYTLLLTETGELVMLELREESSGSEVKLSLLHPNIDQSSKSSSICTYKDLSGMFTSKLEMEEVTKTSESKTPKSSFLDTGNFSFNQSTVDDEDELLYGDSTGDIFGDTTKTEEEKEMPSSESATKKVEPTFWAIVGKENGKLEIYSMPEFKLSYCVRDFPVGNKVLTDNTTDLGQSRTGMEKSHSDLPVVKELMIVGMGYKQTRPYIMAIVGDELYIYEAFPYNGAPELDTSHLKLRYHRVSHGLLIRERKQGMTKKKGEDDEEEKEQGKYLTQFTDVSGYNGVFVSGPCPYWLIMTTRGSLRCHPMSIDGWITCFAPFHNVNCPKGFLYFNRQDELRISVLPTHLSYDAPWPVRKVPLRCTPHYIQYHQETKIYAVVTSTSELCNKICRIRDDEKEYEHIERDDRYIYPTLEKYSMQLFSPVSWEVIPNTKIETDEWETIICLGIVYLTSQGTISGLHGYLAFGTNYSYGEEVASRGRMFLYDIIEVVPEPGKPLTKNKLKMIYDKEQKGPVTAVASVDGDLVAAIGQKIYIFQLKDDDLSAVAFIDTNVYIHSIQVIHNILLVADIIKSVCVLRYQSDMKVLSIVSRDIKPMEVFGIEFLVDNTQLGFVVADKLKNLMIFTYSPEARESHGGQRLVRKADINIGSNMNTMFRLRCKITDPSTSKRASGVVEKKHVTFIASLDGSIGYVLPIKEAVYRRLLMLQNSLNINLQHIAGLNPKAFRSYKQSHKTLSNPQKCILDGELVWNFLNLSVNERNEINKKLGTTTDQLLDDLTEIDRITAHF
ncbi:unnamed protein product [Owenia fusiformis]|uniref:Cleavage and polyadenylation specificity factor subunit 1 n=1 Tax=Owenia fusiformis TaxID=6347 RepID=A0A8J1UVL8_OWEFU|nr:unnamed protein product [Owenia fusiformis]